jgi:hypothetical protein
MRQFEVIDNDGDGKLAVEVGSKDDVYCWRDRIAQYLQLYGCSALI